MTPLFFIRPMREAVFGFICGAVLFALLVALLGTAAQGADQSLIDRKIVEAIEGGAVQIPGHSDIADTRGLDTFTDCLLLQALKLSPQEFPSSLFDTSVYDASINLEARRVHACDALPHLYQGAAAGFGPSVASYYRYWWGSATLARIVLGRGSLSLAVYRDTVFLATALALAFFFISFLAAFRPASLCFLPFTFSVCLGFSLFSMGQSISHAPELIAGMALMSVYNLAHLERRGIGERAAGYGLLGAVCLYFDLLDGAFALMAILICAQWTAAALSEQFQMRERHSDLSCLLGNLASFAGGGVFAIAARIAGYALTGGHALAGVFAEWQEKFAYRMSGKLGETIAAGEAPSLFKMLMRLKEFRHFPTYGVLDKLGTDLFYMAGVLGWVLLIPLCWRLYKKRKLPAKVLAGFALAGAVTPAWFVALAQHTIVHPFMTGRLLVPFAGLGLAAAIAMGCLSWRGLRRQQSSRNAF